MYIPYTCMVQYIDYVTTTCFSYAGSESVYGGVGIEVVRHAAMAAVRAGSSLYQETTI